VNVDGVDLFGEMLRLVAELDPGPVASRLECGPLAWLVLRASVERYERPERSWEPPPVWGVPVVVRDDMPIGGWRMLDQHGEVMGSGDVLT
jgi:hypothetical protein